MKQACCTSSNRWFKAAVRFWAVSLALGFAVGGAMTDFAHAKDNDKKSEVNPPPPATPGWRELKPENTLAIPSSLSFSSQFPDKAWWLQFNDPELTRYIETALANNPQLAIAAQRIEEARGLTRQTRAAQFPRLQVAPSFTRQRNSRTLGAPAVGGGGGGFSGGFFPGQTINFYSIPLTANYEADLFLKNRDRTRSAQAQAQAVAFELDAARISLITEVSNAYFNLLATDRLIDLQNQFVTVSESDLRHAEARFQAGLVSEEDVVVRQGLLSDARVALQEYQEARALAANQLAVLLGQPPGTLDAFPRKTLDEIALLQPIPTGVPSELAARRPDILIEEAELTRANIDVRVARKLFLPTFNLTGQVGLMTTRLNRLLDWDSLLTSFGANLVQALFTGGERRANLQVFRSRYEQQVKQYQQTVLQAFREVDDALSSLKSDQNAYENYQQSLESFNRRLQFQENRLQAGIIAPADLEPTRKEVLLSQQGVVRAKLAVLTDTLSLYKALGGGY